MKAEKKKSGVVRALMTSVTHNWGLKLLALVLAIIVYHSLKQGGEHSHETNERNIFQDK